MKFPVIVLNKSSIDKLTYNNLVCDKRFLDKAFKNCIMVDSDGVYYNVDGVRQIGGYSIFDSILTIGLMVKVAPKLKEPETVLRIKEIKEIIISYLKQIPENRAIDLPSTEEINNALDIKDLFSLF